MKRYLILCALLLATTPAWAAGGDATKGQNVFEGAGQCKTCHKPDKNLIGPALGGIVGRKAATYAGFSYSPALKASGLTWDEATLDKWLAGPAALVSGTRMVKHVDAAQDRADIIAYLKTLPPAP